MLFSTVCTFVFFLPTFLPKLRPMHPLSLQHDTSSAYEFQKDTVRKMKTTGNTQDNMKFICYMYMALPNYIQSKMTVHKYWNSLCQGSYFTFPSRMLWPYEDVTQDCCKIWCPPENFSSFQLQLLLQSLASFKFRFKFYYFKATWKRKSKNIYQKP